MVMRGVEQTQAVTSTSTMLGVFAGAQSPQRDEFYRMLRR
jgi:GTP cyclohydrolase I